MAVIRLYRGVFHVNTCRVSCVDFSFPRCSFLWRFRIVSAGMVVMFTVMLRGFATQGDGEYQFLAAPFCAAVVGDAAVLNAPGRNEEIHFFVLIFICVTAVLFIAGKIAGSART